MKYDYLVLALGGETNFFGMTQVAKYAFTMKSIDDAMILRNHVINMLEQADVESENKELKRSLITFVVVGGGFVQKNRMYPNHYIVTSVLRFFSLGYTLY
ncbi:MAG: hypothetical protein WA323_14090 [Candidatus Nitrosopolaris sp.]